LCEQTALMQACQHGHWEVVLTLMLFKANVCSLLSSQLDLTSLTMNSLEDLGTMNVTFVEYWILDSQSRLS